MKQYLSIKPGETKVIKKSAKITGVINYGNMSYTSTCGALPAAQNALCYVISWGTNKDTRGNNLLELGNTYLEYIEILDIKYSINILANDEAGIMTKMLQSVPDSLMHNVTYISNDSEFDNISKTFFNFQSVPTVAETIIYHFTDGTEFSGGFYVKPVLTTCPPSA